jgi:hypothetical protein
MTKEVENNTSSKIGRPKGAKNKRIVDLYEILEKHDFHPFEALVLFANGDLEALGLPQYTTVSVTKDGEPIERLTITPELRQKSAKDAARHVVPELKAIEHTGDINSLDLVAKLISGLHGSDRPETME